MTDLTNEGERLVKAWLAAQESVRRAESTLNSARCDLSNTRATLAKWLLPEDAKPGEKISVWHGDSLIQAEVPGPDRPSGDVDITVRKRGRSISRAA